MRAACEAARDAETRLRYQMVLLADDSPAGLPSLRRRPQADLYLQDEADVALRPTLTRGWCPKGRRGQRHVETPGPNTKPYGFGLVDWRAGWFDWALAPAAAPSPAATSCATRWRARAGGAGSPSGSPSGGATT